MPGHWNDINPKETREIIENDATTKRDQRSTFAQFAQSDAATSLGRFNAVANATVIGSRPSPASHYPAAFLQCDPVPDEPPLGVDINALAPCGEPHELEASRRSSLGSLHSVQGNSGDPDAPSTTTLGLVSSAGRRSSSRTYRRA